MTPTKEGMECWVDASHASEWSNKAAPDLTPENVGEVVETRPQVDANAPSQLIREICNRMSYPRASKSTSRANPGVTEKPI